MGRPRDPMVDQAIRHAVLGLLLEEGYAGLTIEAVAQRAGVGHTSIYRRWPSKADMVHEVVFPDELAFDVAPGTRFDEAVHHLATGLVDSLLRGEARAAVPGLLADGQADSDLRRRLVDRFDPAVRRTLRRAADEGIARGEVRPDVDVDRVYDAMLGTALIVPFTGRRVARKRLVDSLVDLVLNGTRRGGGV